MPTFRFHGTDAKRLALVSTDMHERLCELYKVPVDYITIEVIHSTFLLQGSEVKSYPLVEVVAFKRPDELEDSVAETVHTALCNAGYEESELYFKYMEERHYYGNGEHY
ncbi:MAG: DUF1904 family protein [Bacteroidales bacterium]